MRPYTTFIVCLSLALVTSDVWAEDKPRETESPKKHFEMHLKELVISIPMEETISSSARPVDVLHDEELRLKAAPTIGETLKLEPGVHGQSFGPGVGLPVIRGQSGPRVRILSNGLGANDASQVSPDHATTVNPLMADRIEVLRGPATLLYGSGAIGGVVNVIDSRIPKLVPEKLVTGAFEQKFNSVSNESSTALKLEGGKENIAYHFDGFYRTNGNIDIRGLAIDPARGQVSEPDLMVTQNTNGFLDNSSSEARGGSAGFSLVGDAGFIGVSGNLLKNVYGIPPEGTDDGERVRVKLEQNKFDLKGEWFDPVSFLESVRTSLSFTDYEHRETVMDETEALFRKDTYEGRVEIPHAPIAGFTGVLGVQTISSKFSALSIEDNVFLTPATRTTSVGVFGQESIDVGPVNIKAGVRVEQTSLDPLVAGNPYRSFTPVSASVSGMWNANEQHRFTGAFSRSQRAPQVQELFFRGFHEASRAFERGNPNLTVETSNNFDFGYKFFSDWVVAEVDLFYNLIDDYIFLQRTGTIIDDAPEVLAQQTQAYFLGYEAKLIFPVMENDHGSLDFTLFSDFTRGRLTNQGDVPQQPPLRWGFQVDHSKGQWSSNLRLTRAEAQNNPGANEANTPSYVLLNVATHYHLLDLCGTDVLLFAKGNNLLNQTIRNSTSFLRNFAPEPGIGAELGVRVDF